MLVSTLMEVLGADFYTGVPDSLLRPLCDGLMNTWGTDPLHHIIAANEGNCVALAAGYHLATGKVPVVYLQNSGEGNIINPAASLLNREVYGIPVIFIIGWRGEPGLSDEPQHVFQGKVTLKLLEDMDISSFVISSDTTEKELREAMAVFRPKLDKGMDIALVVRKDALQEEKKHVYHNDYSMKREEVIRRITLAAKEDPVISTTGKASRELFEIREKSGQEHGSDFLTVGSMGHSSSIALGVALHRPERKVWCVDGDGAALMHMGALAVIGSLKPGNLVHVVINNGAHETVGGMPTVAGQINLTGIAAACGYPRAVRVENYDALEEALKEARTAEELMLIEACCALGARADLGRPTTTAQENKQKFMEKLQKRNR